MSRGKMYIHVIIYCFWVNMSAQELRKVANRYSFGKTINICLITITGVHINELGSKFVNDHKNIALCPTWPQKQPNDSFVSTEAQWLKWFPPPSYSCEWYALVIFMCSVILKFILVIISFIPVVVVPNLLVIITIILVVIVIAIIIITTISA